MGKRSSERVSKKQAAVNFIYGVFITSIWLGVNGVFWWGISEFRDRVKIVEDYGEGLDLDLVSWADEDEFFESI